MSTLVIGALGGTGRLVVDALAATGASVIAGVHHPRQANAPAKRGVERRFLDLTGESAEMEKAFSGVDTVVNTAAARDTSQAARVDRDGAVAAMSIAQRVGVTRWIQISMAGVDRPEVLPGFLLAAAEAKRAADARLADTTMAWTVIRPPWLTDAPAGGRIVINDVGGGSLSRADLADTVVASLGESATINRTFEVASGPLPIRVALARLT
ncbi:NAD(P)H-binding protein [Nocardiopsis halotolerans]|uniref:NAD(P)H-binding protein n=1 Tax=Nocardiopsis halotolerans TaxID=124252 RepID=UPI00034D52F3|nr:NAD(P)H-binding protein [Nocardiopsis halotolerans]